jgi:hypothetical protein
MMWLARRASLVVVLLSLASVGTASAECAWVLWEQSTFIRGPEEKDKPVLTEYAPKPLGGFAADTACLEAARKKAEEEAEIGRVSGGGTARTFAITTGGWRYAMQYNHGAVMKSDYVCFPSTLDARGPKGR